MTDDWDEFYSENIDEDEDDLFERESTPSDSDDDDALANDDDRGDRNIGDEGENPITNRIEGDFDRLVKQIRSPASASSTDFASSLNLAKIWETPRTASAVFVGQGMDRDDGDGTDDEVDENEEFLNDLRAASGIGRIRQSARSKKKGKGKARTYHPRLDPPLSAHTRALLGTANTAYIDNDLGKAIQVLSEVIRIEPKAGSAWGVLGACFRGMAERYEGGYDYDAEIEGLDDDARERKRMEYKEKALKVSVVGAHLRHDPDEWVRLGYESREMGYIQQSIYCFSKATSLDPSRLDAWWERARLAREIGDLRAAKRSFLSLLNHSANAHDISILDELRPVLVELGDLEACVGLYETAFKYYKEMYPQGVTPHQGLEMNGEGEIMRNPFRLLDLLVLADLYLALDQPLEAIRTIRSGARWLQGRKNEDEYWDASMNDDREFDLVGYVREESEAGQIQGFFELDVNARSRLAVARIKKGDMGEGKMHAQIVLSHPFQDYSPLFLEIADALFEKELFKEANEIYEVLGADAATSSMYILLQVAACRRNLGDLKEAADVYEHIISTDPDHTDAKMKLAEIYEVLDEPRKALELVYQVIDARKRRAQQTEDSTLQIPSETRDGQIEQQQNTQSSLFTERSRSSKQRSGETQNAKLTKAQVKDLEKKKEEEVLMSWRRMTELQGFVDVVWLKDGVTEDVERGVKDWLFEAEKIIDGFRETRMLFITSSSYSYNQKVRAVERIQRRSGSNTHADTEEEMSDMASRLQLNVAQESMHHRSKQAEANANATTFRGVSFDAWLELFIRYAFLMTQRDQFEAAEEVLRHVLMSYVYQSSEKQDVLRLAIIACAIHARRPSTVIEQSRKLVVTHQFNNEPLRIMLAALASGLSATDEFISSPLQKHLLREMRIWDVAAKGREMQWSATTKRWTVSSLSSGSSAGKEANKKSNQKKSRGRDITTEVDDDDIGETRYGEDHDEGETDEDIENQSDDNVLNRKNEDLIRKPSKESAVLPLVYGQMCSAVKSYQSALFYLLHAYDYQPNDPLVCLSLTIASLGRAMQRQSDNRNYLIVQAMGFITKYRQFRLVQSKLREAEVEYNYGRAFHQISLYTHAVVHYERALSIIEKMMDGERDDIADDKFGIAKEAAYNLSLIYVTTGAVGLAEQLYRRWLSI